ncbi:hypothetical protein [Mycoplasmopsis agassizii]|uniref:Uncharacterized protein n=1 Tax=Mycoplasmopsis agassizii TaxID=33922 RepID=A0ABX4H4J4_9BACT|nr:hypothetical protein [Mycoplasmopsis agassizii]PAF54814.1 hypothetical protein CJF60_03700 [Mycoplasmopsis agassizii]SMC19305.1 hypothetical protein SAMN02745179_00882 [Mycoplasmopsis agassizii]
MRFKRRKKRSKLANTLKRHEIQLRLIAREVEQIQENTLFVAENINLFLDKIDEYRKFLDTRSRERMASVQELFDSINDSLDYISVLITRLKDLELFLIK